MKHVVPFLAVDALEIFDFLVDNFDVLLEVGVELVAEAADPLARPLFVGLSVGHQLVPGREN